MNQSRRCSPTIVFALLLAIAMFLPACLPAQVDTGGVTGTITDPTGAAVPGAKITLTNNATGIIETTQSTATGTYSFSGMRPATYTLRAEQHSFQTFIDKGLEIHVQQTATIDIPLVAGAVSPGGDCHSVCSAAAVGELLLEQDDNLADGKRSSAADARLGFAGATFRRRKHSASRTTEQ